MSADRVDRRRLLAGGAALVGGAMLGGCDRVPQTEIGRRALQAGEDANLFVQRLLLSDARLAPEYAEADISPRFKPNGTSDPPDSAYKAMARRKFTDFRLRVDGLVEHPFAISLADMRKMPARTQITRHDCVEGWSCIGKWTGVPVADLLRRAGLKPNARYLVLHCADTMEGGEAGSDDDDDGDDDDAAPAKPGAAPAKAGGASGNPNMEQRASGTKATSDNSPKGADDGKSGEEGINGNALSGPVRYYETIDLTDAFHPQTILAYEMNGAALPVEHGAPLRLRLERQLGYKMAKYVTRLEMVDDYAKLGLGRGGYWEDRGYDWYAGI